MLIDNTSVTLLIAIVLLLYPGLHASKRLPGFFALINPAKNWDRAALVPDDLLVTAVTSWLIKTLL
jgi:hypothetical protein